MQQSQVQPLPRSSPGAAAGGTKKPTWSERQALAKKQAEEEEQRSKAASWQSPASTGVSAASPGRFSGRTGATAVGGAVVGGAAATWARQAAEPEPEPEVMPPVCFSSILGAFGTDV